MLPLRISPRCSRNIMSGNRASNSVQQGSRPRGVSYACLRLSADVFIFRLMFLGLCKSSSHPMQEAFTALWTRAVVLSERILGAVRSSSRKSSALARKDSAAASVLE